MKILSVRTVKNKGQMASVLNLFLGMFVIAALGLFAVEFSRYLLAKDQLQGAVEASALCCQTALSSTGSPNNTDNQATAEQAGLPYSNKILFLVSQSLQPLSYLLPDSRHHNLI